MGYHTYYNLEIYENRSDLSDEKIKEILLKNLETYNILYYAFDKDLISSTSVNWYEHDEDMKKISKNIPDVVFLLKGEGENSGDIWNTYYLNGKMQFCKAKVAFDEFDEGKLK